MGSAINAQNAIWDGSDGVVGRGGETRDGTIARSNYDVHSVLVESLVDSLCSSQVLYVRLY